MTSADPYPPGSVIAGKYRIDRTLGEGAMGRVVAATHVDMGLRVALKFMLPHRKLQAELIERFMREARAASRLKGENVVRVFDVGRLDSGLPYLVMELLEGEDVAGLLERRKRLPAAEAAEVIRQASAGIAEAHRSGIIHRDIKPQNLFIVVSPRSPAQSIVKVVDFGISKMTASDDGPKDATLTKVPMGTPLYMAPEQLRSTTNLDVRVDVWALGTTLYELLTGDLPFMASTLGEIYLMIAQDAPAPPRRVVPTIPLALEQIVLKCLEKRVEDRYPHAGALEAALAQFLATESSPVVIAPHGVAAASAFSSSFATESTHDVGALGFGALGIGAPRSIADEPTEAAPRPLGITKLSADILGVGDTRLSAADIPVESERDVVAAASVAKVTDQAGSQAATRSKFPWIPAAIAGAALLVAAPILYFTLTASSAERSTATPTASDAARAPANDASITATPGDASAPSANQTRVTVAPSVDMPAQPASSDVLTAKADVSVRLPAGAMPSVRKVLPAPSIVKTAASGDPLRPW